MVHAIKLFASVCMTACFKDLLLPGEITTYMYCIVDIRGFICSICTEFCWVALAGVGLIVQFQKISILHPQKVFCFASPSPQEIQVYFHTLLLKI